MPGHAKLVAKILAQVARYEEVVWAKRGEKTPVAEAAPAEEATPADPESQADGEAGEEA